MTKESNEYLAHYGVMGMKWGVRNAETLRKYRGGSGRRKAGTTIKRLGDGAGSAVKAVKKNAPKVAARIKKDAPKVAGQVRSTASGLAKGAKETSAKAQSMYNEHQRRKALDAALSGNQKLVKANLKHLSDDDIKYAIDRIAQQRILLRDVKKATKAAGKNAIQQGNQNPSPFVKAIKKGAAEGLESGVEKLVKNALSPGASRLGSSTGIGLDDVLKAVGANKKAKDEGSTARVKVGFNTFANGFKEKFSEDYKDTFAKNRARGRVSVK